MSTYTDKEKAAVRIMDSDEFMSAIQTDNLDMELNALAIGETSYHRVSVEEPICIMAEHEEQYIEPGTYYVRADDAIGGHEYMPLKNDPLGRFKCAWLYELTSVDMVPVMLSWREQWPVNWSELNLWAVVNPYNLLAPGELALLEFAATFSDETKLEGTDDAGNITTYDRQAVIKAIEKAGLQQGISAPTNAVFSSRSDLTQTGEKETLLEVTLNKRTGRKAWIQLTYGEDRRLLLKGSDRMVLEYLVCVRAAGLPGIDFDDLSIFTNPASVDSRHRGTQLRGKVWREVLLDAIRQLDTTHYKFYLSKPAGDYDVIVAQAPDELVETVKEKATDTHVLPGEFDGLTSIETNQLQNEVVDNAPKWRNKRGQSVYTLTAREGSLFPSTIEDYTDAEGHKKTYIRFRSDENSIFALDEDFNQIAQRTYKSFKGIVSGTGLLSAPTPTPTTAVVAQELMRRVSSINHRTMSQKITYESLYNAVSIDQAATTGAQRKKKKDIRAAVARYLDIMVENKEIVSWHEYTNDDDKRRGHGIITGVEVVPKPIKEKPSATKKKTRRAPN